MPNNKRIMVQVLSPTKTLFAGSAVALSGYNERGKFDILPYHANFVALIKRYIIVYPDRDKKNSWQIDIKAGVLQCKNNEVKVFVNI